jgi:hypothetical protein
MEIKSLQDLERVSTNDNMFNFLQTSFKDYGPFVFNTYIVPKENEMRIDLVCNDLYDSTEYTDFLLWFNGIINPFNIIQGTEIIFVNLDLIPNFYVKKENNGKVQDVLLNKDKVKRKDKNRDKFIRQKRSLPPTVNESPTEQIKIDGDSIIIGGNIFNT